MFSKHFRWLDFAYSTVLRNPIPVFFNSFEWLQNFAGLYVRRESILSFWSKISYALITKAHLIEFRNIESVTLNPLQPGVAYLYPPENIRKPKGFRMFSGGIDKQQRVAMG